MSASPSNPPQELTKEALKPRPSAAEPGEVSSGREALQALLAFSALHEQIRQRRTHPAGDPSVAETWQVERFALDEVLQLVAERALAITGADGVAVALAEGSEIVCRGSAGAIAPDAGARLDPNSGFSGACFRSGKVIRCDDAEHDPRVNLQAALLLGARSMVAVPLAGQNCVIGLLEAFSYDAFGFNDSDVRSLNLLAELILAALRPEEEDRLAQISRQVRARTTTSTPVRERDLAEPLSEEEIPQETEHPPQILDPVAIPVAEAGDHAPPGMTLVLVVLLLGTLLGGGIWWRFGRQTRGSVVAPVQSMAAPAEAPTPVVGQPTESSAEEDVSSADPGTVENSHLPATEEPTLSVLPHVTGIRHWSAADSSTVVIDLQDQVQYEAHRLANPERIYFDLHDTALAAGLAGKNIDVGDAYLSRIRVAQPVSGVTRIVLDTKGGSSFSVSMQSNPYRLVVEVRAAGSKAQPHAKIDLFTPSQIQPRQEVAQAPTIAAAPLAHGAPRLRIVLDAGHGGWDLGTVGRQGLLEKDLVLDIVERLGSLIEKRIDAEVIYTRKDDNYIALEKRAEIANQAQADLFVSIHANNSSLPSARGVETYYTNTFSSVHAYQHEETPKLQSVSFANVDIRDKVHESRKIAADIQHALYGALAAKTPGIRNRGVKEASYVVLTGTSMPAVLAEVSFVSSPADETNLQNPTYRQGIAEALYMGIANYAEGPRKVKVASASGKLAIR